ncbi:MAG: hypothetical protein ACLPQS_04675 [Acidimicrobiales bacterium]
MRRILVNGLVALLGATSITSGSLAIAAASSGASTVGAAHREAVASWRATEPPAPAGPADPGEALGPISCTSVGNCVSIGTELSSSGERILSAFTESSGHWTAAPLTRPASSGSNPLHPDSISCASAGNCVADASGSIEITVSSSGGTTVTSNATSPESLRDLTSATAPTVVSQFGAWERPRSTSVEYTGTDVLIYQETNDVWSSSVAPAPRSGAKSGKYDFVGGLSCAGGTCTVAAVYGSSSLRPVAISDNEGSVTAGYLPAPAGAQLGALVGGSDLTGISCTAATTCMAVGSYAVSGGKIHGLLLRETSGSWTAAEAGAPVSADQSELNGISCTAASQCTAVGDYGTKVIKPEVLVDNGGTWTATRSSVPAGFPSGTEAALEDVYCSDATDCLATGLALDVTGSLTFVEFGWLAEESSGVWTVEAMPLPSGAPTGSDSADTSPVCSSAGNCALVGIYVTASGKEMGVADLQTSGGAWISEAVPFSSPEISEAKLPALLTERLPQLVGSHFRRALQAPRAAVGLVELVLDGVACPAAGSCEADGGYIDSYGNTHGIVAALTPAGVTAAEAPVVPSSGFDDRAAELSAISCKSTGNCIAVGATVNEYSGFLTGPLAETWNGTSWSPTQLSLPAGQTSEAELLSVTCSGLGGCAAVGLAAAATGDEPIAAVKTGNTWKVSVLSLPAGVTASDDEIPGAIACAGGNCLAVASSELAEIGGKFPSVLWWYHAGRWSSHDAPAAAGSKGAGTTIADVACSTSSYCAAVGSSGPVFGEKPYVVEGSAASWHDEEVATPAKSLFSVLTAISCMRGDVCEAVGSGISESAVGEYGMIVSIAHAKTVGVITPVPSNAVPGDTETEGISCHATGCLAVGGYSNSKHQVEPELLAGSGTSFVPTEAPVPAGKGFTQSFLESDSCDSEGYCGSIGITQSNGYFFVTGSLTTWSATKIAAPPDSASALFVEVDQISCPGQGRCIALGEYVTTVGLTKSFVEVQH